MEELNIIEERDGYRVRLELDTDAGQPESDGAAPTLQIDCDYYGHGKATAFNPGANGFEDAYNRFVEFRSPREGVRIFERWLRIFHGTTTFAKYHLGHTGEYGYIAFDTAVWRERVGCSVDALKEEDLLAEVRAWAEGDVWEYIVEKEVFWTKQYHDINGEPVTEKDEDLPALDAEGESGSDWFEVQGGSCCGYYGREWAEQAAKEALAEVTVYAGLGDGSED